MSLASLALSLVVAVVCLVAVESVSAQGFGYSHSWSSGNHFQPQQYATGYGYQRLCPPQMTVPVAAAADWLPDCPPQYGVNPYCPPVYGQQPMMPRCGNW